VAREQELPDDTVVARIIGAAARHARRSVLTETGDIAAVTEIAGLAGAALTCSPRPPGSTAAGPARPATCGPRSMPAQVRAAEPVITVPDGRRATFGTLGPRWEDGMIHGHAIVWLPGPGAPGRHHRRAVPAHRG